MRTVLAVLAAGTMLVSTPAAAAAEPAGQHPVVDVLVLYTPQAKTDSGSEASLRRTVARAVDYTNQAFRNSRAKVLARTVAVRPAPDYNPNGRTEQDAAYDYLMPAPAAASRLRDAKRADLTLVLAGNEIGGVARAVPLPLKPENSSMDVSMMLIGNRMLDREPDTFAHELGHLLGLAHDRAVDPDEGIEEGFRHARGYIAPSMKWRDVMAYARPCEEAGKTCPVIPYFSNPRLSHDGEPLGVPIGRPDQADAVSMLNQSAPIVAAYR